MTDFEQMCQALEKTIEDSYTNGITVPEAESLAGNFLHAQLAVSRELTKAGLDSRMRKSGVKAIRAAIYMDIISKNDKKPTESMLDHQLNSDTVILGEQEAYDRVEVKREELERYYNIFGNAHIFYRGVAKGKFE